MRCRILLQVAVICQLLSVYCYAERVSEAANIADTQNSQASEQLALDSNLVKTQDTDNDISQNGKNDGSNLQSGNEQSSSQEKDMSDYSDSHVNFIKDETKVDALRDDKESLKTPDKQRPARIVMQAFGASDTDDEMIPSQSQSKEEHDEEMWTEQTEEGTEQKRTGGRRFFSLMNLIKFLLNPVIEEFQEVEKSSAGDDVATASFSSNTESNNKSEIASVPAGNSSEAGEKEDKKNSTETGKKTKFQCVGRNVTENTTAVVRVVNSTVLLEVLSFDKNHSTSDCVLVMFYAPWCHFCAATAPHYNAIARAFPQLEVLAVDTVHFSNLNARFGTVAVPNIMLFHQSRSAVRFNHTERHFQTLLQFITNTTGLEANSSVELSAEDHEGPLSSIPTEETDYLLWFAWIFIIVCGGHIFIFSQPGQRAIERVMVLWQEHQHQHIE